MNYVEYRALRRAQRRANLHYFESNPLPSATDPTQDIPVKNIQLLANGEPLNVKRLPLQYTNFPSEKLTAADRRNNDHFDAVGELQALEREGAKSTSKK